MDPIKKNEPNRAVLEQLRITYLAYIKLINFFLIAMPIKFAVSFIFLGIMLYEFFLNRSGASETLIGGVLFGYFVVEMSIVIVAIISDKYCNHPGDQSKNFRVFTVLMVFLNILLLIITILPHVLSIEGDAGYKNYQYTILATYVFTALSFIFLMIHIVYLNKLCNHMTNYWPLRQKAIVLGIDLPEGDVF